MEQERTLDRVYQEDWRSMDYRVTTVDSKKPRSNTHRCQLFLDQGREGACVGFGCTHELAARPVVIRWEGGVPAATSFAQRIYKAAQKIDEWPGESYSGTSVLAGMKMLSSEGYVTEYRWCLTMEDLIYTVGYRGPVVIGVNWYKGMFNVDSNGFIHVSGDKAGGHCLLLNGQKIHWTDGQVDYNRSYFKLHNSWGTGWGVNGTCFISFSDMQRLMAENGDFAIPIVRKKGLVIGS